MKLRLVVTEEDARPRTIDVGDDETVRLGREDDNDVVLTDKQISKHHAIIRPSPNGHVVVDGGSRNGIWVGDVALHEEVERLLVPGAIVRMGRAVRIEVQEPPITTTGSTAELALKMVAALRTHPTLVVVEGDDQGKSLELDGMGAAAIGRGADAKLALSDAKVSTRHVEVRREGTSVVVRDLASRHGSKLGLDRLEAEQWVPWDPSRQLEVGSTVIALVPPGEIAPTSMRSIDASAAAEPPAAQAADEPPREPREEKGPSAPVVEVPPAPPPVAPAAEPRPRRTISLLQVAMVLVIVLSVTALVWLLLPAR